MRMTVQIDEELGRKFRARVMEIKGNRKGALSEAVEEAIRLWLEKHGTKMH
jgi:metal-responsive CopG/Arc/MetJ family transcriptional regulator